ALAVLDQFEVGDGDAAGVGEDIGEDVDVAVGEHVVGGGCERAVGGLDDDVGGELLGGRFVDGVFERCRNEEIDVERQQFLVREFLGARVVGDAAGFGFVIADRVGVEPVRVVDRAAGVGDRDDVRAAVFEQAGGDRAGVAVA